MEPTVEMGDDGLSMYVKLAEGKATRANRVLAYVYLKDHWPKARLRALARKMRDEPDLFRWSKEDAATDIEALCDEPSATQRSAAARLRELREAMKPSSDPEYIWCPVCGRDQSASSDTWANCTPGCRKVRALLEASES